MKIYQNFKYYAKIDNIFEKLRKNAENLKKIEKN